jgi:hypothetical protein
MPPQKTLKFTFKLKPEMVLTRITVHSSTLNRAKIDAFRKAEDPNTIDGSITVKTALSAVQFDIAGVGITFQKGSFNFTVGGKKVFSEDQPLEVNENGKISFYLPSVPLP